MGFGACLIEGVEENKSLQQPSKSPPLNSSTPVKRSKRNKHCDSFYWDISSLLIKTSCLALFFTIEAPRRAVNIIARRPEPVPLFTCAKWGYRMCACGHHYYHHADALQNRNLLQPQPPSPAPEPLNIKLPVEPVPSSPPRKRRRWYWPF